MPCRTKRARKFASSFAAKPRADHGPHATLKPLSPRARRCAAEAVEKSIGRGIGPLSRRPERAGQRRKQDELIERHTLRQSVQIPRAEHLGRHHLGKTLGRLLRQHAVIEDRGGVQDAPQRILGGDIGKHARKTLTVGDVNGRYSDPCPPGDELGHCLARTFHFETSTADEEQVSSTTRREVSGNSKPSHRDHR